MEVTNRLWTSADKESNDKVEQLMKDKNRFSDWFVLSLIHSNLSSVTFQNFKEDLAFRAANPPKE